MTGRHEPAFRIAFIEFGMVGGMEWKWGIVSLPHYPFLSPHYIPPT
jgi:hypothetical protein